MLINYRKLYVPKEKSAQCAFQEESSASGKNHAVSASRSSASGKNL